MRGVFLLRPEGRLVLRYGTNNGYYDEYFRTYGRSPGGLTDARNRKCVRKKQNGSTCSIGHNWECSSGNCVDTGAFGYCLRNGDRGEDLHCNAMQADETCINGACAKDEFVGICGACMCYNDVMKNPNNLFCSGDVGCLPKMKTGQKCKQDWQCESGDCRGGQCDDRCVKCREDNCRRSMQRGEECDPYPEEYCIGMGKPDQTYFGVCCNSCWTCPETLCGSQPSF